MPIYEYACPKCRRIFNFLSKRIQPDRVPPCPKCGCAKMSKEVSRFAMTKGLKDATARLDTDGAAATGPDLNDPRVARVISEMERDMKHLDENNPRHLAHLMKKMKEVMPSGAVPKELDMIIKRLDGGEAPEKIEEEMGEVLGGFMGGSGGAAEGGYTQDAGLYDM